MTLRLQLLLAPSFALAMALAFAAAWLLLDRAPTTSALQACAMIAVASGVSAVAALLADRILGRSPWSARFAAALLILVTGTGVLTSVLMGAQTAWTTHPLLELSPKLVLIILAVSSAGALYTFLSIIGFLILPLGVPVIVVSAALIAGKRR